MNASIFDTVERDLGPIEHFAGHAWHDITSHIPHYHHQQDTSTPEGPAMSALTDVEAKVGSGLSEVIAKLQDLADTAVPVIHDGAQRYDTIIASPIVASLLKLAAPLDPAAEQAIVALIDTSGAASAKIAELTAPAAPAAA